MSKFDFSYQARSLALSKQHTINVQSVILCGGAGTRLWPLSRAGFPKQFLCLAGEGSLFQQAARRLANLETDDIAIASPIVVCNEDHRFLALEQLREIGFSTSSFLLEPIARNTAAALSLAALATAESDPEAILVVSPSDPAIGNLAAYNDAVHKAIRDAVDGAIVILGVTPDRPETGYGYIHTGGCNASSLPVPVSAFVEKPDLATAERYLASGDYFWNAGMFVLKASTWLAALAHFRPGIMAATRKAWDARQTDEQFVRPNRGYFAEIPAESIDYAVMEKCPGSRFPIRMVQLDAGWNDLGAWDAVWKTAQKDVRGNAMTGDVIATGSNDNLVHATSRLVSLVGVSGLVVVETADAVLVVSRECAQQVKAVVDALEKRGREERALHRKVHRPWGWYDSIDQGDRFKVKRIQVNPGASLSLQMHHHRAEHWVVVKGTADVTCGTRTLRLVENQSTFIPLGETHRLANPADTPLEIIEVQSGHYLGEDDIVRFDDEYGRGTAVTQSK
jgi:mannose-1-phosphate guanylyltransferase / mannose-6-phosphate isomerase